MDYNQQGMEQLQSELFKKFGSDAWYSEITVLSLSESETIVQVKETTDPNSLRGKSWVKQSDSWIPSDDVLFQFNGGKPQSHLFQLNHAVTLNKLVQLIELSRKALQGKGLGTPPIHFVSIQSAMLVADASRRILYTISFRNSKDGKSFSFVYDLNGSLVSFDQ